MLGGCISNVHRDPAFAAVRPVAVAPPDNNNGAIYQAGYDLSLFGDRRARRVGDLLTVILSESTSASKQAKTELDKTNDTTITAPNLLGSAVQFNAPGVIPLASNSDNTLSATLSSDTAFDGEGKVSQSNNLTGNITVTVAEVLPNGNLVIRGEKFLTLNQGDEFVRISGIVRPTDISSSNTVLSSQVADAQIAYSGEGAVADTNVIGWLSRFFISTLFPF